MPFPPFLQKPPVGTRIQNDHPLAQGLVDGWLFHEKGGGPISLRYKHQLTLTNSPTWAVSQAGDGLRVNAASLAGATLDPTPAALKCSPAVTVFWRGVFLGNGTLTSNPGLVITTYNNPLTSPFVSYGFSRYTTSADRIQYVWNDGTTVQTSVQTGCIDTANYGRIQTIAQAIDPASCRMFVDGAFKASSTSVGASIAYAATSFMLFMRHETAGTNNVAAQTSEVYVWNRKLVDAEIKWLHEDPYSFLDYRRLFPVVKAPAAGLSIPVAMYNYRRRRAG